MRAAPQGPVARLGGHGEAAVAFGVARGQPYAPVAVVGELHLPVVAPPAVALPAQHAGPAVEPLRAVGQVGRRRTLLHLALVVRQPQPRVVGQWVEDDVSCGRRETL